MRITAFSDRIEIASPGPLPLGVNHEVFEAGRATPKWRNQALAWIFTRLQLSQAEGQGIPTILRTMRDEGCPPPEFQLESERVISVLPAHPRHALVRAYEAVHRAISIGDVADAHRRVAVMLDQDPTNYRTVQLLIDVQRAAESAAPILEFVDTHHQRLNALPPNVLIQLADVLLRDDDLDPRYGEVAVRLLRDAAIARTTQGEARRIALGLGRAGQEQDALAYLEQQIDSYPEWNQSPAILQALGNTYIGLAKRCTQTARRKDLPKPVKQRAWADARRYLDHAERALRQASALLPDAHLEELIQRNLAFLQELRVAATPPRERP